MFSTISTLSDTVYSKGEYSVTKTIEDTTAKQQRIIWRWKKKFYRLESDIKIAEEIISNFLCCGIELKRSHKGATDYCKI